MYSNMCVNIALCLALVACIDGYHRELPLSPDGMVLEITVKNKGEGNNPVSFFKINIDEKEKKVVMSMPEVPFSSSKEILKVSTDSLPTVENRNVFRVGTCPLGYTKRGGFCFPDDDY